MSSLDLIGSDGKETRGGELDKGKFAGLTAACAIGAAAAATAAGKHPILSHDHEKPNTKLGTAAAFFSFGIGFYATFAATYAAVFATCDMQAKEAATMHAVGTIAGQKSNFRVQKPPANPRPKPYQPKAPQAVKPKMLGQWARATYDSATDSDCAVTYTCRYGRGWDEVGSCPCGSNEMWCSS